VILRVALESRRMFLSDVVVRAKVRIVRLADSRCAIFRIARLAPGLALQVRHSMTI
jgi:hypothetical protein